MEEVLQTVTLGAALATNIRETTYSRALESAEPSVVEVDLFPQDRPVPLEGKSTPESVSLSGWPTARRLR